MSVRTIRVAALAAAVISGWIGSQNARADDTPSAEEGLRVLQRVAFYAPDFDAETLDQLDRIWPENLKREAEALTPAERRRMIFDVYGLTARDPQSQELPEPLGFVPSDYGWAMNCLACHGGELEGKAVPGLGNQRFDMQSFYEDLNATKARLKKPRSHMDGSVGKMVFSTGPGLTAAVNFGIVLGAIRDDELELNLEQPIPPVADYGMDVPPLWNVKYKQRLYCDDFSPKNHRVLMQFILHPWNSGDYVRRQEKKFEHIAAWIESLEAPKYPYDIDNDLAGQGKVVFERNCAECHGRYDDDNVEFPEVVVPIETVGTDPVRLNDFTPEMRAKLQSNWMNYDGRDEVITDPGGYLAPPLKGIWATAPYFHNGSVPTLWHVLHPERRPQIWRRNSKRLDVERVGIDVDESDELPADFSTRSKYDRRSFFNANDLGKSTKGHDFPSTLSEPERKAVLEYLKTL